MTSIRMYTLFEGLTLSSSSTTIKDIACLNDAGSTLMAYFYFDFRDLDKQHRRNLLPSLLVQLSSQSRPCCDIFSRLYSTCHNGAKKPSDEVMIQCLKDMLAITHRQPILHYHGRAGRVSKLAWNPVSSRTSSCARQGARRLTPPASSYLRH
jgi:hypothetical protein